MFQLTFHLFATLSRKRYIYIYIYIYIFEIKQAFGLECQSCISVATFTCTICGSIGLNSFRLMNLHVVFMLNYK